MRTFQPEGPLSEKIIGELLVFWVIIADSNRFVKLF